MSQSLWIHVTSTGDVWLANNPVDTPAGTITATFKVTSDGSFRKIGSLSGTISSSLTATGTTGKHGQEK